jgi:hypothetical protein
MNRYAMPVHQKSIEKDFESHALISEIPRLVATIKAIKTKKELSKIKDELNHILFELWFSINFSSGINLRDREKLYPLFKEVGRLFGVGSYPFAYRGVRLSDWDANALSETYTDLEIGDIIYNPKEPRIVDHLEGLAYGLRSWTPILSGAESWASYRKRHKDKLIFQISNPEVVLDANEYLKDFKGISPFDWNEIILFIKNPKIVSIEKTEDDLFLVKIKDN